MQAPPDSKTPGAPLVKRAYTIDEVTHVTPFGRTTIYEEIRAGRLKALKRGKQTIITDEELTRYIAALPAIEPAGREEVA